MELTHASFFSGVGGLDLGLERAGWRTVSFSEIDPYASAVLAERWPGVPNLGDIVTLADRPIRSDDRAVLNSQCVGRWAETTDDLWATATLWSGGFPCQDLSVAGKRAGFGLNHSRRAESHDERRDDSDAQGIGTGSPSDARRSSGPNEALTRSGLAFAFLDLVEQHRPPAILLENVPGLLSSNGGRDFGELLRQVGELGYGWAYRILDAQFFGVPQRRRRVFILAFHAESGLGADSAAAVLSVGSRCDGHSATGDEARTGVALGTGEGIELAGSLTRRYGKGINTTLDDGAAVVSPSPDPGGVRAADGLAGRLDDRQLATALRASGNGNDLSAGDDGRLVAATLNSGGNNGGFRTEPGEHLVYRKSARVSDPGSPETWVDDGLANTLNSFDVGDIRTTHLALGERGRGDRRRRVESEDVGLLPLGLDSHRYRCCGNGVVSNVSEWIGVRLAAVMA